MRQLESPLTFVVYGRSRPKGSLRHRGGGRLTESVVGSSAWKGRVAESVLRALGGPEVSWEPVSVPLNVSLEVVMAEDVTALRAGDLDKHVRSALDSLTQGKAILDDRLCVFLVAAKRSCGPGEQPHVVIRVEW